jgi:hypothetical protein
MNFGIYDVFYSLNSHQHVSAGIPCHPQCDAVTEEHKNTNVFFRVTITP